MTVIRMTNGSAYETSAALEDVRRAIVSEPARFATLVARPLGATGVSEKPTVISTDKVVAVEAYF